MKQLYIIPDKEKINESLELAKEYNATFEYNDFYVPELLDDTEKTEQLIQFYLNLDRDVSNDTMHGAFFDITIHSDDPLIRQVSEDRIRKSMSIASKMGIRAVIFHTGRLAGFRVNYYIKNWLNKNEIFFRQLLKDYPNVDIYMENMFDEAPDILAQFAENMKDEPRFGVCFDYAHASITDVSCDEWIKQLAPYIKHMHINDNDLCDDLHDELGLGKIDWENYTELIDKYNIDSSVLVEIKNIKLQKNSIQYMIKNGIYPMNKK